MHESVFAFAFATLLLGLGAALVHRWHFPPLAAYLLVGLMLGRFLDTESLEPLPSLGLLLLLFSVGLEFGPDRLQQMSGRVLRAGAWDALVLPVGTAIGLGLGLDWKGALLLGGVMYVSSSAVIVKLILDLRRAANPESEVVLGVLVFEDLLITLLLVMVQGGSGLGLAIVVAWVGVFWLLLRLGAPWINQQLRLLSDELVLLLGAALVSSTAVLFHAVGASEAVAAFICGAMAAGLGLRERLEHLLSPVRDLGVALFFLTVGAQSLALVGHISAEVVVLSLLAMALKLPLNFKGGQVALLSVRRSYFVATYLVPRGEFNLILGALAMQQGYTLVGQVAVLLVLISIPLGSLLMRLAPHWYDRKVR
ncbi:cation:proton antiporter [Meiothermus hypogaeus]|uniref:Sodium:proton antiporter n=2 Tax=Meiothermus hypogaeus TaxID=884155 RepID=A0A511QYP3_9DEIN|nr:cation:proton antiporter [Meiothermus hypogaeus]RIH80993.1 K(+)/H(+) antiporter YhaU [Meiothermus hypogaeus]GEM82511.1 sodium:proton antiporter [Meiothermus hypogaeus NBRC 106114]